MNLTQPDTNGPSRSIPWVLVTLALLSYGRLYMLRDAYADDNCWLLGMFLSDDLSQFLDTGFRELRREPLGIFLYFFFLPLKYLDNPFVAWHSINIALQVGTPLVLYALVRNLSSDRMLGAFAAAAMIVLPLDNAVPYLTAVNYRVGLFFGLTSLYLTDEFARRGLPGWRLPAALVLTLLAEYVLIEAVVGFEAARLIILWNRYRGQSQSFGASLRSILKAWAPFVLLTVPLIAYKLLFKPYGIYAGTYPISLAPLFNPEYWQTLRRMSLLGQWNTLRYFRAEGAPMTVVFACMAGAIVFGVLVWSRRSRPNPRDAAQPARRIWLPLIFTASILVPMIFIFFLAGRPPSLGIGSTYAALLQPGYAILVGFAAYAVVSTAARWRRPFFWGTSLAIAGLAGAGVYFNNLNLDLFNAASAKQTEFWQRFKARFPELPPRADFLVDAAPTRYNRRFGTYYHWEDLYANYDLEYVLNTLYAPRRGSGERRYRVYVRDEALMDLSRHGYDALAAKGIHRQTHYGSDTLNIDSLTAIYYRDGRLLVNSEITRAQPNVGYRRLADKPLPPFARP